MRDSIYPKLAELLNIIDSERGNLSGDDILLIRTRLVQTQRQLWTSPKNQGEPIMSETDALSQSTQHINCSNLIGYFPFLAANFLVDTGRYVFWQSSCWGYILKKI